MNLLKIRKANRLSVHTGENSLLTSACDATRGILCCSSFFFFLLALLFLESSFIVLFPLPRGEPKKYPLSLSLWETSSFFFFFFFFWRVFLFPLSSLWRAPSDDNSSRSEIDLKKKDFSRKRRKNELILLCFSVVSHELSSSVSL